MSEPKDSLATSVKVTESQGQGKGKGSISLSVQWCGVDKPLVLSSFACFFSFIIYGACLASLGASVPFLALAYDRPLSDFSVAFALRGGGYLAGTVYSAAVLEGFYGIKWVPSPWYKKNMLLLQCIMTLVLGLSTGLIVASRNFQFSLFLFFVQGCSFGGCDTIANVLVPSLWGDRTQPWMQALHSCFGIGALTGPSLIGSVGLNNTLLILCGGSFIPSVLAAWYYNGSGSGSGSGTTGGEGGGGGGGDIVGQLQHVRVPTNDKDCEAEAEAEAAGGGAVEGGSKEGSGQGREVNNKPAHGSPAKPPAKPPLPGIYQATFAAFFLIYVGAEASFGSWISTYVIQRGLTDNEDRAAFAAAYYWASLTAGRVLSIALALFMTASQMINVQLVLCIIAGILNVTIMSSSYNSAVLVSCCFGFALSSVFPLAMTVVGDYGYSMDGASTAAFIVGSCVGDGSVPWLVGMLMGKLGPRVLPVTSLISVGVDVALFVFFASRSWHRNGSGGSKGGEESSGLQMPEIVIKAGDADAPVSANAAAAAAAADVGVVIGSGSADGAH